MANRQEIVCTYIYENYVASGRLRHSKISDKLVSWGSIKKPMPLNRLGMLLKKAGYRDVRRGEQRTRGWIVYERTLDEVNASRNKKE